MEQAQVCAFQLTNPDDERCTFCRCREAAMTDDSQDSSRISLECIPSTDHLPVSSVHVRLQCTPSSVKSQPKCHVLVSLGESKFLLGILLL